MARIKVTPADIETLESRTSFAYDLLKRGVQTSSQQDIEQAKTQYGNVKEYLASLTIESGRSFRYINMGGKRAKDLERYILQCVLMQGEPRDEGDPQFMIEHIDPITKETNKVVIIPRDWRGSDLDGMEGLKMLIDSRDFHQDGGETPEQGWLFRFIEGKAAELRQREGPIGEVYGPILTAMEYVRGKYPVPM